MKRTGRVHWLYLVGIAGVILLAILLLTSGSSPSAAAGEFMRALAKGDVNKLTELTYIKDKSSDQVRKEWDFAVNTAGPYYRFAYQLRDEHIQSDKQASVTMDFTRNFSAKGSYSEHYELPLVKQDGKWKVVVPSISREIFPDLPR